MARAFSLLALVVALGVALWLYTRQAQRQLQPVSRWSMETATSVTPQPLDWKEAQRAVMRLAQLLSEPSPSAGELEETTRLAAQWVAGSQPGTPEYRLAVALRAACFALAQAGPEASDPQRQRARRELATARSVLSGESPGSVTQGIQDHLKNLQVERGEEVKHALEEP